MTLLTLYQCIHTTLEPAGLKFLEEALDNAKAQQAKSITLVMDDVKSISTEALRFLVFTKQKLGANFNVTITGASGSVKEAILQSEFSQEIKMT